MKILGKGDGNYLIVEMPVGELEKIVGRNLYWHDIHTGDKFNVQKQWEALLHAKLMVEHSETIEQVYTKALEAIKSLKLQDLERALEGDK